MLPILLLLGAGLFDEPYRPQYHFTPAKNWMNDPNGLIFHKGEYHLFFQYNPFGDKWGHMSWGHAVSRDLVHWQELPVALAEENGIMMFSGSAVTQGERMMAIYTGHTPERQHQNLAFSEDNGRTWKKFEGNPVIDEGMKDFRDPKVTRYKDRWVMVVALPKDKKVRFYESRDLKSWTHLSDFGPAGATGGIWECPDLFELDGRWVLVVNLNPGGPAGGSGGQYFVGQFDGKEFKADRREPQWIDYGADMYATVSFFGTPGRKIWLGWMSNWLYAQQEPTTPFRTAQTLPRQLRLKRGRIVQQPVKELRQLRGERVTNGDSYELEAEVGLNGGFRLRGGTLVGVREGEVFVDRRSSGNVAFHPKFGAVHAAPVDTSSGRVRLRVFVDRSSVEVFVNDGEATITDRIFPEPGQVGIEPFGQVASWRAWRMRKAVPENGVAAAPRSK
jgi:fructan beta-fructosidase